MPRGIAGHSDAMRPSHRGHHESPTALILAAAFGGLLFVWAFSGLSVVRGGELVQLVAVVVGPVVALVAGCLLTRARRRPTGAEAVLGWLIVLIATPSLLFGLVVWAMAYYSS